MLGTARVRVWGLLGLYVVGSCISWLIVGEIFGWRTGAKVGATVALIGVVLAFLTYLVDGLSFAAAFLGCMILASIPIGILAWSNGAHGYAWLWTAVWIGGVSFVLQRLRHAMAKWEH